MKNVKLLFLMFIVLVPHACASEKDSDWVDGIEETCYFKDDFDSFNEKVWTKEVRDPGWVNQELQAYDEQHVTVGKDGDKTVLILTAEHKNGQIYSGRIHSKGKMSFKHRKVEACIRLPKTANGLWPAFWMMGDNEKPWPQCGEIDIMEMGEKNGIINGTSETYLNTAIHYGASVETHRQEYYAGNVAHSLQDGTYHLYTLEWTEQKLSVWIDQVLFYTFDISKVSGRHEFFQDECYVLFNLAVGGAFPNITDKEKISALREGEKAHMYVDWIKVY